MVGSMVAKVFENRKVGVPNYIAGVDAGRGGIDTFSFGSAYLGPATHPFWVSGDPSSPKFEIKNLALSDEMHERLEGSRTHLLRPASIRQRRLPSIPPARWPRWRSTRRPP